MIGTLLRIGWINLRRDRVAQALTFLLPIIFFSIFAMVFGNQRSPSQKIRIAVADEDHSEYSRRLVVALQAEGALRVQTTTGKGRRALRSTVRARRRLIRDGALSVTVVLPKGLGASPRFWRDTAAPGPRVALLADVSDPIAPQMVQGLLQKVSFTVDARVVGDRGHVHVREIWWPADSRAAGIRGPMVG